MKNTIALSFITFLFTIISCKNEPNKTKKTTIQESQKSIDVSGNYVSDAYQKRDEGYDWVAVKVTNAENENLNIQIRSRADKKKPTCTFDVWNVNKLIDNTYQTFIDGKAILFQFSNNEIIIIAKNEADNGLLSFYCSGGASISGSYKKIDTPLDEKQIDKTQFSKVLNLQNVGFNVSVIKKEGGNQLTVFTFGLPNDYNETFNIGNETVINAEVEDLNSDGSPELVVFTNKNDEKHKTAIYAFSVNNQKSMSQIYFKPIEENLQVNDGYNGKDEFTLIETYLVQRFPIYKNGIETGKIKQIQYQLIDGEASRKFIVKEQNEYNIK